MYICKSHGVANPLSEIILLINSSYSTHVHCIILPSSYRVYLIMSYHGGWIIRSQAIVLALYILLEQLALQRYTVTPFVCNFLFFTTCMCACALCHLLPLEIRGITCFYYFIYFVGSDAKS